MMQTEKNPFSSLMGKMIVTKEGKRLGFVKDITFETKSGELINLVVKEATIYTKNLNLERTSANDLLIPYSAIIAIGDFVIVSEEDLI
jgi:sporulation protein YlmC with PRC-barrel domain